MRLAIDTNVLVYAEGVGNDPRTSQALRLLSLCTDNAAIDAVLPVQVLGELFNVLTRKLGLPVPEARERLQGWADSFNVADAGWATFQSAIDLCDAHGLQFWDALILCTAAEQRCRVLLSEDFHTGFTWHGLTVVNPFATPLHPLLQDILTGA
jgi:predicted nucleic acid-binding protein